jgi:4-diphosphocytidyl-2-C-methyl-D-erythritol kinase
MPTANVYRRFDEMKLGRETDVSDEPDWRHWTTLQSKQLLPLLLNDLERPAFDVAPELRTLRERVEESLGQPVRMSGSGSSLFTLFDTENAAKAASERIGNHINEKVPVVELAPFLPDDLNEELINR